MHQRLLLTADETLVNPAAFTSFAGLQTSFFVEEDEMLVRLTATLTFSNTVVERTDFTLLMDGADLADGTNGLACMTPAVIGDENTLQLLWEGRLAAGEHTLAVQVKAPTGDVTLEGATIPCVLNARRHSHPATLGHGVDSKVQLIQ
jgi:hypothetical protein